MVGFQMWHEIFSSLRRNKLKTALTGFAVAWGIFMLIVLLAAGNGLKNGMALNFKEDSKTAVWMWTGFTNMPYKGLPTNRHIQFTNNDYNILRKEFSGVGELSPIIDLQKNVVYNREQGAYNLRGVMPDFIDIEDLKMEPNQGHFINQLDCREARKVVVVSSGFASDYFKNESPLGKQVSVDGIMFTICGVYIEPPRSFDKRMYIPITTAQQLYGYADKINEICFNLNLKEENSIEESKQIIDGLKTRLASYHQFDVGDSGAMGFFNTLENFMFTQKLFAGISLFVWIIGIGTLIAGVVGISNIMLISVKERTKEFGIRRAIGAQPGSILSLVIIESVGITGFFGYIGMVLGVALTETVNYFMQKMPTGDNSVTMFYNPTVDLNLVLAATLLLVIAGVLAGYFPARNAVKIKPIDALRDEQ